MAGAVVLAFGLPSAAQEEAARRLVRPTPEVVCAVIFTVMFP